MLRGWVTVEKKPEQLADDLQAIVDQLRGTQDESAAALAPELSRLQSRLKSLSESSVGAQVKKKTKRLMITLLVILIGVGATAGWLTYSETVKHSKETFVTGVQAVAKLATAEAYVMTTIEGHDNKIFGVDITVDLPGTKRAYFVIVPAKLLAGVDLQGVTESDVSIDPIGKKVSVSLPHATYIQEAIQMDQVKIYTDEGIFRSATTAKEGLSFVSEAQVLEKLRAEANAMGVLKTAEENAVKTIQGLYPGYEVRVEWK